MKLHFVSPIIAAGVSLFTIAGYSQTTITSVPITISTPGKYVLKKDLTLNSGGTAITVTASNVTINLNGFTLIDGPVPNQNIGVNADGVDNLIIQNGTISQFQGAAGIQISSGSGHMLQNLQVQSFGNAGITLTGCNACTIATCEVSKNFLTRSSNSWGIGIFNGTGNRVTNSSVSSVLTGGGGGAVGTGILSQGGTNYFDTDYIASCITGIAMSATDKYRAITTSNCKTAITGGIDVDDVSN
jgi:hypothetical protein